MSKKINGMLTHTNSLINHVYWFKQDLKLQPSKEHIASAIQWTDIVERRHDFLKELVNTVVSWVYNKSKSETIVNERLKIVGNDTSNAYSFLTTQAFSKFRPGGFPQGQFGELLLFNFIQHFFEAVPLLRKQRITTSVGHERFGSDAIHYKENEDENIFILGESKCYKSKYNFKKAFKTSLSSIVNTVENLSKELDLYTYDDFIEPELEDIAKKYKRNELENVRIELICLVAYNETKKVSGTNEREIQSSIKKVIEERCKNLDKECYEDIDTQIICRINYIIFPIWELDKLLDDFEKRVGAS
jgi:hypothetical protein